MADFKEVSNGAPGGGLVLCSCWLKPGLMPILRRRPGRAFNTGTPSLQPRLCHPLFPGAALSPWIKRRVERITSLEGPRLCLSSQERGEVKPAQPGLKAFEKRGWGGVGSARQARSQLGRGLKLKPRRPPHTEVAFIRGVTWLLTSSPPPRPRQGPGCCMGDPGVGRKPPSLGRVRRPQIASLARPTWRWLPGREPPPLRCRRARPARLRWLRQALHPRASSSSRPGHPAAG